MNVFVARQPIFTEKEEVVAYELLYRSGEDNFYDNVNGDQATTDVIINSFLNIGIDRISNRKKCFINFTENLLIKEIPFLFPHEHVVVEILENVEPTDEIIAVCKKLKEHGYTIALDDFVLQKRLYPLVEVADIVKIDFLSTSALDRLHIVRSLSSRKVKFLAEKVETREQFQQALSMGFTFFQGYFFSKPVILTSSDVPVSNFRYLQLLQELSASEPDVDRIARNIELDLSLSYKLLKLINSAAFGLKSTVTSIKHAVVLLGLREIRKWVSIIALKDLANHSSNEMITSCLIRARIAESLSSKINLQKRKSECFLMGLLSMVHVLLQKPMEEAISDLPLSEDVKDCLLGKENQFRTILDIILTIEKADWHHLSALIATIPIQNQELPDIYLEAIDWVNEVMDQLN
ncbi:hypothetical protein BHU72_04305 [Desulfuribacillus stibiiarsenatis]|uniref:HDOD domain-containing protein n=1 Tax=Desulfuribacillus stibiiarsenatis TaxID=1390249 RepID=A0A1E5L5I2_9FIRM|nr:HDOD domain-containing protein [Desulfuribacillus stibiiarsenatis]OEH85324.1 hypothetical protein BHU72_04305 [Desulfuribacillus stibiiarsenatis]